jgi:aryl-alcohol dehydrogenase-like predicted oxidoreductase
MIQRAEFGRTGHSSSRLIFGAAGLGNVTQDEADAVLEKLLAHQVNHLDTAASYDEAELRMGPWMAAHRQKFFLATKTGERTGPEARASLERSLERLRVDKVDLVQLHNLVEENEWEVAFSPTGAVAALQRAREEGLVDFIGVTGHGVRIPQMHLRSLERFDFDSVLFPYNATMLSIPAYRTGVEALIEVCVERRVAVQTIKAIARGPYANEPAQGERRLCWYEPLTDPGPISRAVRYVLGRPGLFLISSADWRLLPVVLEAAESRGSVPQEQEMLADREVFGVSPLFN